MRGGGEAEMRGEGLSAGRQSRLEIGHRTQRSVVGNKLRVTVFLIELKYFLQVCYISFCCC